MSQKANQSPDRETRRFPLASLEVRAGKTGKTTLVGHAAVFNAISEDLGGFRETIRKGAFAGSLSRDVRALFNHDPNLVLGRSRSGTLRMEEDEVGLRVEVDLPNTSAARDLAELVARGDVDQMSFAFRTLKDQWSTEGGEPRRELLDVELYDVSLVTFPAYPQTDIKAREQAERILQETRAAQDAAGAKDAMKEPEGEGPRDEGSGPAAVWQAAARRRELDLSEIS